MRAKKMSERGTEAIVFRQKNNRAEPLPGLKI
jgi:hypothetical protein